MPRQPVLKLSIPFPLEEDEHADLIDKIDRNLHLYPELERVYHVPNGAAAQHFEYVNRAGKRVRVCPEGRKNRRLGVRKGVLDLAYDQPRGDYSALKLEMKRQNASPSDVEKEQIEWRDYLRSQGIAAFVVCGCEEAWKVLMWYMSLPARETPVPLMPDLGLRLDKRV